MDPIATKSKERLPKGFSYPVGAERLSANLAGVAQYDKFNLWFRWRDEFWASRYKEKLKSEGKITLVDVRYSHVFDEWRIDVYALPSEQAAAAKALLTLELFNNLKNMLEKHTSDYFHWKVDYSLKERTIEIHS